MSQKILGFGWDKKHHIGVAVLNGLTVLDRKELQNGSHRHERFFFCSYAGLHCVVIKGYSKSAGYQPGVSFDDNRFRNSWNAVFVDQAWRFVQCNWGARHLVNAKDLPKSSASSKPGALKPSSQGQGDSLRYEYDDHYFLTDPEEFIYEFYPLQSEWQLLRRPVTLLEFEQLPFVRSLFFRYGLWFPDETTKAVIATDASGAATLRITMPVEMTSRLIFHYNLKFYDKDGKLKFLQNLGNENILDEPWLLGFSTALFWYCHRMKNHNSQVSVQIFRSWNIYVRWIVASWREFGWSLCRISVVNNVLKIWTFSAFLWESIT